MSAAVAIRLACLCLSALPLLASAAEETAPVTDRPAVDRRARIAPDSVLPAIDPDQPMSTEAARAALAAVAEQREPLTDALLRERIACYDRFFVNACIADVDARERRVNARLDRIRVAANRSLREDEARALNERAANDLAARRESEADEALRREQNRREHDEKRQRAAAQAQAREAEAAALAQREAANRADRARREAAVEARRVEARARAAQDETRAAQRQRNLDAQQARQREREAREAREAPRRAARQAEAARRAERERQIEQSPPAPRRIGNRRPPDAPRPDAPLPAPR